MIIKALINHPEIEFLTINTETGRVQDSGSEDLFEDTFVKVETVKVGETPTISFNYGMFSRPGSTKTPIFVELNYIVTEIITIKK